MQTRYRTDYEGEFVLVKSHWYDSEKTQDREWVENIVNNQHISSRAVVIGSDVDDWQFDFRRLARHRGGILGTRRLQSYGSGDIWKQMKFDFVVSTVDTEIQEMLDAGYHVDNVVFTNTSNVIKNPGNFYVVPYQPRMDQLATAVYMAAFDGHEEVFLVGYNKDTPHGIISWEDHVNEVFESYPNTSFFVIGVQPNMPNAWFNNTNVSCMSYHDFVMYCDI